MYRLFLLASAEKDLDGLEGYAFAQIKAKMVSLKSDPRPPGSLKLTAHEGYRLRYGDYRILYGIDDEREKIYIYKVKHRREAYR